MEDSLFDYMTVKAQRLLVRLTTQLTGTRFLRVRVERLVGQGIANRPHRVFQPSASGLPQLLCAGQS